MEELIALLEATTEAEGRSWWLVSEPSELLLAQLGVNHDVWRSWNRKKRVRHVVDKVAFLSGIRFVPTEERVLVTELYDVDVAQGRELSVTETTVYEVITDEILNNRLTASQIPESMEGFRKRQPTLFKPSVFVEAPRIEGNTLTSIGQSWIQNIDPTGHDVLAQTLSSLAPVEVGGILAAVHLGGVEIATKFLTDAGLEEDDLLGVIALVGVSRVSETLDDYYLSLSQEVFSRNLLDTALMEFEHKFRNGIDDWETPAPPGFEADRWRMKRYLIAQLWHVYNADDLYLAMSSEDRANADAFKNSDIWKLWKEKLAMDGDLDQYKLDESIGYEGMTVGELEEQFNAALMFQKPLLTSFQELGDIQEIIAFIDHLNIMRIGEEKGLLPSGYSAMIKGLDKASGGDVYGLWEIYEARHPEVLDDDSLLLQARVLNILLEREMEKNPNLSVEDIDEFKNKFNEKMNTLFMYSAIEEISQLWQVDPDLHRRLREQGDGDILEAMFYVQSGNRVNISNDDFSRILFNVLEEMDVSPDVRDIAGVTMEQNWQSYLNANSGSTGLHDVIDAKTWLTSAIAEIESGELDKTTEEEFTKALFSATRAVDKARVSVLTPVEQLLVELGTPISDVNSEMQTLFQASKDETADMYWERLESVFRKKAELQKMNLAGRTTTPWKAPLGLLNKDSDFRDLFTVHAPEAIHDAVYAAEATGLTISEIVERRRRMLEGSKVLVQPNAAATQALSAPGVTGFLDALGPILGQLPLVEQSDAQYNALLQEQALRVEFEAQLPTDEAGVALTGRALELEERRQREALANYAESRAIQSVANKLGLSVEEVTSLTAQGALSELSELTTIAEQAGFPFMRPEEEVTTVTEEVFVEGEDPEVSEFDVTDVTTEEVTTVQAPSPPPPDLGQQAINVYNAVQEQRLLLGAPPPSLSPAFTFEEFIGRQGPGRFKTTAVGSATPSAQLATRRVR